MFFCKSSLSHNRHVITHNTIDYFSRVIAFITDESEDMWHAYNLITKGDSVTASTVRKVQTESVTGSSTSNRVRTTLTIQVETIDFDTQACVLRLKGRNIVENQYVKVKLLDFFPLIIFPAGSAQHVYFSSISLISAVISAHSFLTQVIIFHVV